MKFEKSIIGIVYAIVNTSNGKRYIGSTLLGDNRRGQHLSKLRRGKHHCKALQEDWNLFGANSFIYEILEEREFKSVDEILCIEQELIFQNKSIIYNTSKFAISNYGCSRNKKKIKRMDWGRRAIKIYNSLRDIEDDGFNPSSVRHVLSRHNGGTHKGYKWSRITVADKIFGIKWSSEADPNNVITDIS